jgi:NAD(P)H-hydrate epimerase
MRTGVGKLTVHTQETNRSILQVTLPEAILDVEVESRDKWSGVITKNLMNVNFYSAVGMGPGVGTDENAFSILSYLLTNSEVPLVLDADALNIIAAHPGLMEQVPPGSILTPHKGELSRLLGPTENSYEQMQTALQVAQQRGIYIIAKD